MDVTGEISGGNERTHYYLNFGMDYNNDLVKYGEAKNNYDLRFNVRGNVDMQLASWLKATTNAAVVYTNQYRVEVLTKTVSGLLQEPCAPTGSHPCCPST